LTQLAEEITDLSLALIDNLDRTYYLTVVAYNENGSSLLNCIEVELEIPKSLIIFNPDSSSF